MFSLVQVNKFRIANTPNSQDQAIERTARVYAKAIAEYLKLIVGRDASLFIVLFQALIYIRPDPIQLSDGTESDLPQTVSSAQSSCSGDK
jgi:hypothetical protein